jgi:DNA-binding NtrC family response regulator
MARLHGTSRGKDDRFGLALGRSQAMHALFDVLERVAPSMAPVLLLGETGTGKEVIAESIHRESARSAGPFMVVNCAALRGSLAASELFGFERGSFTGADATRVGPLEAAQQGTIFLDEIGDLAIDVQPALLRFLESGEVQRLGSPIRVPVDVRVIAATSRNLHDAMRAGEFRPDLYHRLAVVELAVPPLRDRIEDLPLLVGELVAALVSSLGDPRVASLLSDDSLARLARHGWPGNVRELRNYIERYLAIGPSAPLEPAARPSNDIVVDTHVPLREARLRWVHELERRYLHDLMERVGNNVTVAAREAGLDRVHFYRLLRRAGLHRGLERSPRRCDP